MSEELVKKGKIEFIERVWNAKEKDEAKYSKYRQAFKKLYPTFFEFIESFKQGENGTRDFTEVMTKIETKLFINTIVRRIVIELGANTFVATIHDALIYKEEDREAIERIMDEEVCRMTGISGMVSTTTLKEESGKAVSVSGITDAKRLQTADNTINYESINQSESVGMRVTKGNAKIEDKNNSIANSTEYKAYKEESYPVKKSNKTLSISNSIDKQDNSESQASTTSNNQRETYLITYDTKTGLYHHRLNLIPNNEKWSCEDAIVRAKLLFPDYEYDYVTLNNRLVYDQRVWNTDPEGKVYLKGIYHTASDAVA